MTERSETVGFIGLGVMGSAMAGHLLNEGFSLVIYDIDQAKCRPLVSNINCLSAETPAEVMRLSILHHAQSIIVLHNHPSGNTRASHADIQLTKRIQEAGTMLGVLLDDHIIIAGYDYVSMRSEGLV